MTLPLSNIVQVTDSIEAVGVLRKEFGIGLFFTSDDTLGTGSNRVAVYSNFQDMSSVFAEASEPYKAGNAWFAQSPFPKNLVVTRWIQSDVAARLIGGVVSTTVSGFAALLMTGYIKITIDGVDFSNIELVDRLGRIVMKSKVSQIDMSTLDDGLYLIKVLDESNKLIGLTKVIKQ